LSSYSFQSLSFSNNSGFTQLDALKPNTDYYVIIYFSPRISYVNIILDTLQFTSTPAADPYQISGSVYASNVKLTSGKVVLYKNDSTGITEVQTQAITANGYRFDGIQKGQYLIYAVPDTNLLANYIPTYYVNKLTWNSAYLMNVTGVMSSVDIQLIQMQAEKKDGSGSISGDVKLADSTKINKSSLSCEVYLLDSNKKIIAATTTKPNGSFSFTNLAEGTYSCVLDKAGYSTTASSPISLSAANNTLNAKTTLTMKDAKSTNMVMDVPNISLQTSLKVYPNPAKETLKLNLTGINLSDCRVSIYNTLGLQLTTAPIQIENDNTIELNINQLTTGIYYGKIEGQGFNLKFKFLKE
jgi:hypothetical protein